MASKLVGQNYVTPDLVAKVTGKAKYAEDYKADGMLYARLLLSPLPHARIRNIDVSAAQAMPSGSDICRMPMARPRRSGGNHPTTTRPLAAFAEAAAVPPSSRKTAVAVSDPARAAPTPAAAVVAMPAASTLRSP